MIIDIPELDTLHITPLERIDIPELDTLHITPRERFVLLEMAAGKDFVRAVPGGWYCDLTRIGGKIGYSLWEKVLIKNTHTEGTVTYFKLNQRGKDMAERC